MPQASIIHVNSPRKEAARFGGISSAPFLASFFEFYAS